jgi:hypothetical protein
VQQGIQPPLGLIPVKVADHRWTLSEFEQRLDERKRQLLEDEGIHQGFTQEISRFLPPNLVAETVGKAAFWSWLTHTLVDLCTQVERSQSGEITPATLRM